LPALGIAASFLVNRHGSCPLCGGKDRFRFDDKDGTGSYYCNQCGPGRGILLVQKLNSWDYATACREIDNIIGADPPRQRPKPASPSNSPERRLANLKRALAEATAPDIVGCYLQGRGLKVQPDVLRGHRALPYFEGGKLLGRYPAMIAPIIGPDGQLASVHRTYIADVPSRKKMMPPVGTIRGAAARLAERLRHSLNAQRPPPLPASVPVLSSSALATSWQPRERISGVVGWRVELSATPSKKRDRD
jgi:putative DNA primase/helicase